MFISQPKASNSGGFNSALSLALAVYRTNLHTEASTWKCDSSAHIGYFSAVRFVAGLAARAQVESSASDLAPSMLPQGRHLGDEIKQG
jgi:hypothetical protein